MLEHINGICSINCPMLVYQYLRLLKYRTLFPNLISTVKVATAFMFQHEGRGSTSAIAVLLQRNENIQSTIIKEL